MTGMRTIAARFWSKVQVGASDECWLWTGAQHSRGYGSIKTENGKKAPAHRVAYELVIGPIPEGLHIDHLCTTPLCVNPTHLEPVTLQENNRRRDARKNRCARGHDWTDEANVYLRPGGTRECRACATDQQRARRARRRA